MTPQTPAGRFATAEIIAVGSEMLTPYKVDTNSLVVTARLDELGIQVRAKTVVGDDRGDLTAVFVQARARVDLLVLTGGLGPTADDLTREVVAAVLGRPLVEDLAILESIRRRFASRGLRMPDVNRKQALVPQGATPVPNPNGTAPGIWMDEGDRGVLLLPGPPRELEPMMERFAREVLAGRAGEERLHRRVLKITGRTESQVEELTLPIYSRWQHPDPSVATTILATPGQVELHLSARSRVAAAATERLAGCVAEVSAVLGADIFSADGRALEEVVGELLRERGLSITVAESCTGGLITSRLTDVAGSSAYVRAGVVGYGNAAKVDLVGVPASLIDEHGAVSEPVALAMAEGAGARTGAAIGVGVTGIAGPGGATPEKPVGTVAVAVAGPQAARRVRTYRFLGGRALVKFQASQAALDQVRRAILETETKERGMRNEE
jgi:nicotinamide-nucleotide amidase